MRRLIVPVLAAALLGGCSLVSALDRMDRKADERACDGYGFRAGTDAYSNCMMQQAAERAEDDRRLQDRQALERARRSR